MDERQKSLVELPIGPIEHFRFDATMNPHRKSSTGHANAQSNVCILFMIAIALIVAAGCQSNSDPFVAHHEASPSTVAWQHLGTVTLDGTVPLNTIEVGALKGKFHSLSLTLRGSSAELKEVKVYFTDGKSFNALPDIGLDNGNSSADFDVPGDSPREIDKITFKPVAVGSGPPKIVVYGR